MMLVKIITVYFIATSSAFATRVKRLWETSSWTDNCSLPPEPAHGSYMVTGTTETRFGERWPTNVVFTCWSGYTLVGAQGISCVNGRWSDQIPRCVEFPPQFTSQNTQPQQFISQPQQQQYIPQQQRPTIQQQQYIPQQQQPTQQQQLTQQQQQPMSQQQLLSELERIISQQQQLGPDEQKLIISQLQQQLKPQNQQSIPQQQQFLPQQQQQFTPQLQQCIPQQEQSRPKQQPLRAGGLQLKKTSVRTGGCILPPYPDMGSYKLTTVMNPVSSNHQLTTNLTFSCDYSRILEGPRSIICIDGRWSDNSAYCRERRPEEGAVSAGGVGGRDANARELPWHVGIYDKASTPFEQVCGGTIVTRNRVISAAHCFWDDLEKLRSASQFAVGAGKLYRSWTEQLDKDSVQTSDVRSIRIPPRYQHSATNFQEDIALLRLTGSFTFNAFVMPATLDFDPAFDARHLREGNFGKVGGWGLITESGMPATKLQVLQLPYIGIEKCITENEPGFLSYITADKICAGYRNGTALCMGDSGGGLVFVENSDDNPRYYLRGIVSTAPTNDNACNIYAWTTFTHVLRQELFIKQ